MSRAGLIPALLALAVALSSCGDDAADDGVDLGPTDGGGRDAAADAAATTDARVIDEQPQHDAGRDAMTPDKPKPTEDDDGGLRCNAGACRRMSDACNEARCNDETGECELTPRTDGTACGDDTLDNCTEPDSCKAGKCVPNDEAKGTACGDQDKDCRKDDACDGHGQCVDAGFAKKGSTCGDQSTHNECNKRDSCNDQGECLANLAPADAPCGDQDELCRNDDSCDGQGQCVDGGAWTVGQCPLGQNGGNCLCGSAAVTTCHLSADICVGTTCMVGNAPDGTACGNPSPTHAQCDAADSCESGVCATHNAAGGAACGNGTATGVCDRPDSCDGAGACSPNHKSAETVCSPAAGVCLAESLCNGTGSCQAAQPAPDGTQCGSQNESICDHADSCDGAGACAENPEGAGTACGDPDTTECSAADTCDGDGACDARNALPGSACGDQGEACLVDDICDDDGECSDQGMPASCAIHGTLMLGNDPADGVTIELLGTAATSTTSSATGEFELDVPLQQPVLLYIHAVPGYWGFIQPTVFTSADAESLFSLISDADVASVGNDLQLSNGQTAPVMDTGKGIVAAVFNGDVSASDLITSSATSEMPIALTESGPVYSSTVMSNDSGTLLFFDVEGTSSTLTPSAGCQLSPSVGASLPIRPHVMTFVNVTCD